MRTRAEMKALAKQALSSRYWLCVGMGVLYALLLAATSPTGIAVIVLSGPLLAGYAAFCVRLQSGAEVTAGTMFTEGLSQNFGRKVGAYWWRELLTFLWSLLFVIPGIVKSYAYALQPYLLADCPNVRYDDSLRLSERMMRGHKWELFVLQLSFIGWGLLSAVTCGLVWALYAGPYYNQTVAQFYLEVRHDAVARGAVSQQELWPQF